MAAPRIKPSQRGFTLVELMIGMVLGLFILLALITLWVNINRNNTELSKANRLIENGRLALQLLQSDAAHAGFLGGFVPNYDDLTFVGTPAVAVLGGDGQIPAGVPDPCLAYSAANWTNVHVANLLGIYVQAYEVPADGTAPVCAGIVTNAKPGTHVLVVRHLEPCTAGSGASECGSTLGTANPHVYFQASRCESDPATYVLAPSGHTLRTRACGADLAPIYRYASALYYVRTFSNTAGDGIPTLMRSTFGPTGSDPVAGAPTHLAAQPLIEGVEGFIVRLGIDSLSDTGAAVDLDALVAWAALPAGTPDYTSPANRGDGNPDGYVTCTEAVPCTADQLMNVVTVKVDLLMRAETSTPGFPNDKVYVLGGVSLPAFNDNFKRQVFSQTIRLTNVSGRRETP